MPVATIETMIETAVLVKNGYLESVAERFRAQAIEVGTRVLMSARTSEDIVSLALSEGCDLVIRYLKGDLVESCVHFQTRVRIQIQQPTDK